MRVLIVDDDKRLRETLKNIILNKVDSSLTLLEASEGKEALEILKKESIDVLLTDILMPVMNGFELIKRVRRYKNRKDIFIAVITGLSDEEQIKKIYASGADFYIAKPFVIEDIVARLKFIMQLVKKDEFCVKDSVDSVVNLFDDHYIYHTKTLFNIEEDRDIFLLWKHFSQEDLISSSYILKDIIVELHKVFHAGDGKFEIILENSKDFAYITVKGDSYVNFAKEIISESEFKTLKVSDDSFTIRMNLNEFDDEEFNELEIDDFLDFDEQQSLNFTTAFAVSAEEFLKENGYDEDLVDEMESLRGEFFAIKELEYNDEYTKRLNDIVLSFSHAFGRYLEFSEVRDALLELSEFLNKFNLENLSEENRTILRESKETLVSDLFDWYDEVFVKKEALNVHYGDDSTIANIAQLKQMYEMMQNG